MMHGQEKHFFMGWFDDEYINSTYVITIYNKTGQIVAFANFMQEYQVNDIGIDLMRRLPTTEDGTMDFLFISLIQWVKEQGYGGLNLSLSPLAKVGNYPSDPLIERAIHAIYEHVNLFYNFKGLYTFKQKFHPHWKPRYLVYAHLNDLPLIAIALFRLSTSDQFVLDYFRELLTGLPEPNPIKLRLFSR
jgi:phosphatidylglycerol lysyltransferase